MTYEKIYNTTLNDEIEKKSMDCMGYLHENIFPGMSLTWDYYDKYKLFIDFALGASLVHNEYIKKYKIKKIYYELMTEAHYYVIQNNGYISYCFVVYQGKTSNFVRYARVLKEELDIFNKEKSLFKCETIEDIVQYYQLPYVCEIPHLYKRLTRTL